MPTQMLTRIEHEGISQTSGTFEPWDRSAGLIDSVSSLANLRVSNASHIDTIEDQDLDITGGKNNTGDLMKRSACTNPHLVGE